MSEYKSSLTMGLDVLLGGGKPGDQVHNDLVDLPLEYISTRADQPRKNFSEQELEALANSIKENGVLQPILVRKLAPQRYELIAGERRFRASLKVRMKTIPALIKEVDNQTVDVFALVENIQRMDLNPIEEAQALFKLQQDHDLTQNEIADIIGKKRATVANKLRLLKLHKMVQTFLADGLIEMGHARALLSVYPDQQVTIAHKVIDNKLSVREVERLVQAKVKNELPQLKPFTNEVDKWIETLSQHLSSKVTAKINEQGQGRLVIHFSSPEEVDWIVNKLTDH